MMTDSFDPQWVVSPEMVAELFDIEKTEKRSFLDVILPTDLEDSIRPIREHLDRYPALKHLPLEIHEFGLSDENNSRLSGGECSEWSASWYAAIGDIAYRQGIRETYDWVYSAAGLLTPRGKVIQMLERMAGGQRLDVAATGTDGHK